MNDTHGRRILIVGSGPAVCRLYESFQQSAPPDWRWLGAVGDEGTDRCGGPTLGPTRDLAQIVAQQRPTDVVVAVDYPDLELSDTLMRLGASGVRLTRVETLHEQLTERIDEREILATVLQRLSQRRPLAAAAKRALDLATGMGALAALALVYLPLALALTFEGAGSVFVAEQRVGLGGRRFNLLRFRTYRDAPSRQQWPFVEGGAKTRTGALIERFGIDRLPQALAIVRGHLSLVGPRAEEHERQQRLERESPLFRLRTVVKPGLTGWEQLHRGSRSIYDVMRPLQYDAYYIKHQSLGLDLRILMRTALALIRRPTPTS